MTDFIKNVVRGKEKGDHSPPLLNSTVLSRQVIMDMKLSLDQFEETQEVIWFDCLRFFDIDGRPAVDVFNDAVSASLVYTSSLKFPNVNSHAIAFVFRRCKHLKSLSLCQTNGLVLLEILRFNVGENAFHNQGSQVIASFFEFCVDNELELQTEGIAKEGISRILVSQHATNISKLTFSTNNIGQAEIEKIAFFLQQQNIALEHLSFRTPNKECMNVDY